MQAPGLPENEAQRLATLHSLKILDTPSDDRFDRYARISTRIFDVPMAVVSLVDRYRQWFKAAEGLDAKETPREISFCGHAILGDDVFEIQNARRDPRFRDNPLVIDRPNIRFYAGAPLAAPNGHKLGTLCIIDRIPRRLSDDQKTMLKNLADMVVSEMINYVDTETGLANRNALILSGSKYFDEAPEKRIFSMLLFDINDAVAAHNDAESSVSPREKFGALLKEHFTQAQTVAHVDGRYFCVLIGDMSDHDRSKAISRLTTDARKSLFSNWSRKEFSPLVGVVEFDPEKHVSINDVIADTDSMFSGRNQQERKGIAEPNRFIKAISNWRKTTF